MVVYKYTAINSLGKKFDGMICGDTTCEVKTQLRNQKVLVVKIVLYKNFSKQLSISKDLLISFTHDIYILLHARLPLYEALSTLEEKYQCSKLHVVFLDICDQIKKGVRLSCALKKYPKIFDSVYISMVKVGEESGSLERSFLELHHLISRVHGLKKSVIAAMIYPAFLGFFCFSIIVMLVFFLIPSMQDLFTEELLHPITRYILTFSSYVTTHVKNIVLGVCVCIGMCIFLLRNQRVRMSLQHSILRIPILKHIYIEFMMGRFCRVFSALFGGGLSINECLSLSKYVVKHSLFEAVITDVEKRVLQGDRFSEALKNYPLLIPNLLVRIVSIAEESGKMTEMMNHLSNIYEENVSQTLSRISTFIQPVLIVCLGIIIGVILLAVLLPLTDVSTLLQ